MKLILLTSSLVLVASAYAECAARSLAGQEEPCKIRVACIGDSITWGTAMTNRVAECYPAQLQSLLGDRYEVVNFGDPGSGVYLEPKAGPSGFLSHPWRTGRNGAAAYAFKPDIVVSEDAFFNPRRPGAYEALIQWILTVSFLLYP